MTWLFRSQVVAALALIMMMDFEALAGESLQLMIADTTVNHMSYGELVFLWDGDNEFYASEEELIIWRVRRPFPEPVWRDYRPYYRIGSLKDVSVKFDSKTVSLMIDLPPALLKPQRSTASHETTPKPEASTGVYFDYDISYADEIEERYAAGLFAPTLFTSQGILHNESIYRHSYGSDYPASESDGWMRLETNFIRDDPNNMRSYRVGDVLGAPGLWGSSLRIGGAQIATNFSTRPSLSTFPMPSLEGTSATPSAVDLYVDGVLRHQQKVDSGIFRIDDVPSVNGAGEIKMVVTDVLGREQVVYQDFYVSSQLLRPGLVDYSYSLGLMRENYGYTSNDYGDPVFIGAHRQGINENWTAGGRTELSSDVQLIGFTSDRSLVRGGIFSSGFGLSRSDHGVGGSMLLGYEYQTHKYRLAGRMTGSSRKMAVTDPFRDQLGEKFQMALSAGISRGLPGSLGASLVHQSYWDGKAHQVGTVTYSQQFAGGFFMSLYSSYLHSSDSDFMVGLSFTKSLGERRSSSTTTTHQNDNTRVRVETQQNVPTGTGVGYRLGATLGDRDELDGSLHGQTDYGHYSLDARYFDEGAIWRAGARGSVAWLAGKAYLAREISRGFAVATVGDLEDVRVYLDNHEIGRTDEHGRILLPSLRPYETNRVRIEPEDLPLGMEVDALTLEISPYLGSGTVASFPVRVSRQAILYAMQPNGLPVPEGSTVQIVGDEGQSIAGVNGLIYLKGLQTSNRVRIAWGDEQCEFDIPLPEGEHPLPSLGTFVCEEAAVK